MSCLKCAINYILKGEISEFRGAEGPHSVEETTHEFEIDKIVRKAFEENGFKNGGDINGKFEDGNIVYKSEQSTVIITSIMIN